MYYLWQTIKNRGNKIKKTIVIDSIDKTEKEIINNRFENLTIPNLITYSTLACALSGIFLLLNSHFLLGALLIWSVCDIFDTMDGFIARKFNMFSPLGADLDSLIDVIAFLIPPFLISLQTGDTFLLASSFFFVFSGIYRLARFNVEKNANGIVVGLQASLAAHLVYFSLLLNASNIYLSFIFIGLSLLMISPIKSNSRHSLYLTAILISTNIIIIALKLA